MTRFSPAHRVILATGWRRALIAFLCGGFSVLAFAPFHLWPILFLTFPPLVWLIDGSPAGRIHSAFSAAIAGWFFGFGFFLFGLYWVGNAFLVDAKTFGWLLPIAVTILPAGLALFTGLGFGIARAIWPTGAWRIVALAIALTGAEWLRGHVLTGFPWNAFGYALTGPLVLAQGAALIGLWGLTFLAVAIFASPAILWDEATLRRRAFPLALALLTLVALAAFGGYRLATQTAGFVDGVKLRIMQPNLSQGQKFNYAARADVMSRYVALSDRATGPQSTGMRDVTHLVWPESPFPFLLTREPDALAQIAALLPPDSVLITGGIRAAAQQSDPNNLRAYNSVYIVDHDGTILSAYDKVHLVPFGEYLPLQPLLEKIGLRQLTNMRGGFLSGDRRRVYDVPRAPMMLPLICYEIIFPGAAVPGDGRPGWMLNLTNDGWFGDSIGPYQHFHQARIRAIEEGLPLVRAANTGISAVVDPFGRVVNALPLGVEGVLDSRLPHAAPQPLYARMGDMPLAIMMAGLLILVIGRRHR